MFLFFIDNRTTQKKRGRGRWGNVSKEEADKKLSVISEMLILQLINSIHKCKGCCAVLYTQILLGICDNKIQKGNLRNQWDAWADLRSSTLKKQFIYIL